MDYSKLSMPVGEAMFTQRATRRLKTDPIPMDDIRLILEAAVKAPNGGNSQPARFMVLTDPDKIRAFGALYKEAWWAKRSDQGWKTFEDLPKDGTSYRNAAQLAEDIKDAPCIIFAFGANGAGGGSVLPATQNLMLAARALGIGSVPTTLHECVMDRFYAMFNIPKDATFQFCIPIGYPKGNFGPTTRKPTAEVSYLNGWGEPVPWS
ncbi:MAG: nitroreductase family protein [Chloroflexi bacterium]|nr:nitroreductase family protein [Chloroflexota bacterium]